MIRINALWGGIPRRWRILAVVAVVLILAAGAVVAAALLTRPAPLSVLPAVEQCDRAIEHEQDVNIPKKDEFTADTLRLARLACIETVEQQVDKSRCDPDDSDCRREWGHQMRLDCYNKLHPEALVNWGKALRGSKEVDENAAWLCQSAVTWIAEGKERRRK